MMYIASVLVTAAVDLFFCSGNFSLKIDMSNGISFFLLSSGLDSVPDGSLGFKNDYPQFLITLTRGLRQVEPLSPFLFVIGMKILPWMLDKAQDLSLVKGSNSVKMAPPCPIFFVRMMSTSLVMRLWLKHKLRVAVCSSSPLGQVRHRILRNHRF